MFRDLNTRSGNAHNDLSLRSHRTVAMNMASKKSSKSFLGLYGKNSGLLTEPTVLDQVSAGEDVVAGMIEEGLDVLGENVGRVILYHLETSYGLKRDQIAEMPDLFMKALREMFGEGSFTVEKIIVENMSRKTGITLGEAGTGNLPEVVRRIRELQSHVGSIQCCSDAL